MQTRNRPKLKPEFLSPTNTPKRVGFGGFPDFLDFAIFENQNFQFRVIPSMADLNEMNPTDFRAEVLSWEQLDAVVWRLSGEDPLSFIWQLKLEKVFSYFESRNYLAAFWTMDSHHMSARETLAARHFDHVFVAHVPYLESFKSTNSSFLPCSFSLAKKDVTEGEIDTWSGSRIGAPIGSYFVNYAGKKRNSEYFRIREKLDNAGIRNFLGLVRGGTYPNGGLIRRIMDHKVSLNLSLSDDLNMRNFEALALNRILLTNKVPGHEILSDYTKNIVFFRRGLEDFQTQVFEALERTPEIIGSRFLNNHHIDRRVEQIVFELFGLEAQLGVGSKLRIANQGQGEQLPDPPRPLVIKEYGQADLFASGGLNSLNWGDISSLVKVEPWQRIPLLLISALFNGLFDLVVQAGGSMSRLRAIARKLLRAILRI